QVNDEVLSRIITSRIGCSNDEKMYIVPIRFAFNGNYLLAHSREGLKINMLRQHPEVCFLVVEIDVHANCRTVVLWGS
ncbi:pyridoxamine 5'-phosphate oxidase family protein, partial [Chitinophaga sp. GbtcB8]|uniref:pyridoxamine 5'-phosphate oxidase family protein n=1 Tax=Chitinophaga sp. GbtcB8 TaxID=2824753 RepID=UPI001C2FFB65